MKTPSFDIRGKVAVITSAAGILCSEMAREMAALGCKVAVLDLKGEAAEAVAQDIRQAGYEAAAWAVDVLDKGSIQAACDGVLAKWGRVDILVNGAGGNHPKASTGDEMSFFDLPTDALQWVFNLNFVGTVMATQVFGKVMQDQKSGNVINICSMSGIRPLTKVVGYSAAKAALANFTQWMATYFNDNVSTDIRVNAIAPGFLLTEQNRFLMTDRETGEPTPRGRHVLQQTPMKRYGQPEELVGAIVFLASPAASFVNGVILPIDGGFAAYAI